MAMYGESSFNALQLIFHFSNSSMMPLTWEKFQNSLGLLENLENLLGLFLMRSDIFSRLLKWRALHHYHNVHKILKSLIFTALRKLSNHTEKGNF